MNDDLGLRPADVPEMQASDLGPETAPRLAEGVGAVFLDDEGVLLDPATGASHVLDQPATLVTRFLDGRSTLGEIAFDIADVLELDRATVERDVVSLVRTLGAQGLLAGVARDPHAGHDHDRQPQGVPVGADLSAWPGWSDVAAGPVLVVNWGTRCGFCTRIVPDLAQRVPAIEGRGTSVVLVTTGGEESLREQVHDVTLPVLHVEETPDFFAGIGTPAAYLVAGDRTVVEPIAIGAFELPGVLARLAGQEGDEPA